MFHTFQPCATCFHHTFPVDSLCSHQDFISNNRGINEGEDIPQEAWPVAPSKSPKIQLLESEVLMVSPPHKKKCVLNFFIWCSLFVVKFVGHFFCNKRQGQEGHQPVNLMNAETNRSTGPDTSLREHPTG